MSNFINFLTAGILAAAPLLFGLLGELLTEKSGNLNLGVEGMMFMGGIAGISGVYFYEKAGGTSAWVSLIIALVCSLLCAGAGALIFSVLTITLRANQNVTGLTLTIFGGGMANFFGGSLNKLAGGVGQVSVAATSEAFRAYPQGLVNALDRVTGSLGLGTLLFSYGFLTYVALALAIVLWYFLGKTRSGLSLRAVGENPATADAAGINVTKYKYLATCLGAGISGLGGLFYVLDYNNGIWATTDAKVARTIGWNFSFAAVSMALRLPMAPLRSSRFASSRSRIALLTTTPISMTIAMRETIESEVPVNTSARITPMAPIGMVNMMMNGCRKLSSRATSRM